VLGVSLGWQAATELGVFAAVAIVLAWRLPNIIEASGKFTKVILKHQIDKKRIPEKAKSKKANLAKKIADRTKGKKV
jgi:hypothetical protein